MHSLSQWNKRNDERPKAERMGASRAGATFVNARFMESGFPAKAPITPFARPPYVTSGQLLRISLLVLASLIYSDPSPFMPARFFPSAAKLAAKGVDATPASNTGSARAGR